jgi:hypothetical protein
VSTTSFTLRRYYSSFKSISGILAGIVAASPYISKVVPVEIGAYSFPPLGDVDPIARVSVVIFAFATTFGVYFWKMKSRKSAGRIVGLAFALSALAFCLYMGVHLRVVRRIDIPSLDAVVYVSIGYERTAFAQGLFGGSSDEDLLRARGIEDEQIRLLWTIKSLVLARLVLYLTYLLFIVSLVGAFSIGVADYACRDE